MSDISELETRITAALERINIGLDQMAEKPAVDTGAQDELKAQLEDERTANAQLTERLSALKSKSDDTAGETEQLKAQLAQAEAAAESLRQANQELRNTNDALREASKTGVVDATLINNAMTAELSALKATQQADRAELDAVLTELSTMAAPKAEEDTHA
ncbi:hypothetical protein [Aliiroseovarius sp. F20344]|uniref:hypothetical protein n=1 Tax=Aliiroseovarius sp. F20344 TaxID=2926414 RepID=UPI001FF0FA01|nr:hypothetical protein [Aliiroseovarius sp. F20344]MCK0142300.1 hypothetical protein [Aliiroseovarius sp. F20344]